MTGFSHLCVLSKFVFTNQQVNQTLSHCAWANHSELFDHLQALGYLFESEFLKKPNRLMIGGSDLDLTQTDTLLHQLG